MKYDRYSGDPKLYLDENGVDFDFRAGQPVMDQGLENHTLLSLFTAPGWVGNKFLPTDCQIGSDFEETCRAPINLKAISADIPNSAKRALKSDYFPHLAVSVTNPMNDRLSVTLSLGPGSMISADRKGLKWIAQAGGAT